VDALMSFFSNLFGGGRQQAYTPAPAATPLPKPTPAAPRIGDGPSKALQLAESSRQKRKKGVDDTILTGLGDVGGMAPAQITRTSLLGGG
jgi:hypothetical protein